VECGITECLAVLAVGVASVEHLVDNGLQALVHHRFLRGMMVLQ
jgi:hypothetical protein